jgi:hypothetical protein
LLTKRICLGAGRAGDAPLVELMPSAAAQECRAHPPRRRGLTWGLGMGTGATRHRTYLVMALEDELNVRLMEMVAYGEGIRYFCAGIEAAAAAAQRSGSCVTCRPRHHQSINSYFSNAGEDGWTVALPLLRHGGNYPRTYRESQSQRTPCSASYNSVPATVPTGTKGSPHVR